MFVDKHDIADFHYITLLLLFNTLRAEGYVAATEKLIEQLAGLEPQHTVLLRLDELALHGLIRFTDRKGDDAVELVRDGYTALTWLGVAFLINHANDYVKSIQRKYRDIPENLIATLVPYLKLQEVPAADRYVNVKDNQPDFQQLISELEIVRDEIARDENKNEYPIKEKRAVVAELDGVLAQLKRGYIRLSTLTTNLRPLLHDIAEVCKDVAVIAGAAGGALWAIRSILAKLF